MIATTATTTTMTTTAASARARIKILQFRRDGKLKTNFAASLLSSGLSLMPLSVRVSVRECASASACVRKHRHKNKVSHCKKGYNYDLISIYNFAFYSSLKM